MKCEDVRTHLPDFLTGELSAKDKSAVAGHVAACGPCAEELHKVSEMWTKLGVLPAEQPSPALRDRFYTMLEAYSQGLEAQEAGPAPRGRPFSWRGLFSWKRPAFRFAAGAALLLVGVAGGVLVGSSGPFGAKLVRLEREVEDMRQTTALSLLEQPSSSERLLGVSYSERVRTPNETTIAALLRTLDTDPSINVRLAAADALYLFAKDERVKEGLIASLGLQESPLVQVALIDLLTEIRERRAIDALKALIADEKIHPDVRERARQGVKNLTS
jgi:anti-sigma factor RsiW